MENEWYFGNGFESRGSYGVQIAIEGTKKRNYEKTARAKIKFK